MAEQDSLQAFLSDPLRQIVVRLGTNAISGFADEPDLTNFVECDFPGYAPLTLVADDFGMNPLNEPDCAEAVASAHFESGDVVTAAQRVTCYIVQQIYNAGAPTILRSFWAEPTYVIDEPHQELNFDVRLLSVNLPAA